MSQALVADSEKKNKLAVPKLQRFGAGHFASKAAAPGSDTPPHNKSPPMRQ